MLSPAAAPWVVEVALVLQVLGSTLVVLPLALACSWLLLRAGRRAWAWWLGVCAVGGWGLTQLLKQLVRAERPPDALVEAAGWSFPSGHTTAGIYGWAALGVVALVALPRPWNRWVGALAVTVGVLMGPSRLVLGVHWFSDVVGGLLVAGAWVLAVSAVTLHAARRSAARGAPQADTGVVSGSAGIVRT
jgi:undecaprenyl-diphosphatase